MACIIKLMCRFKLLSSKIGEEINFKIDTTLHVMPEHLIDQNDIKNNSKVIVSITIIQMSVD